MRAPALLSVVAASLACGDLFHSTDWETRCADPSTEGCGAGSSTSADGGGAQGPGGASTGGGSGGCMPGDSESCYSGPAGTADQGICQSGMRTCEDDGSAWGPCEGEVTPEAEVCGNATDENCDGSSTDGCPVPSCNALPPGSPSGAYMIDPTGGAPDDAIQVYCDMDTEGGGWAMVVNSIGGAGDTLPFWQLTYSGRFVVKGTPSPGANFYAGVLYQYGVEYRDVVHDLSRASAEAARVTVGGFDPINMTFVAPTLVSGLDAVFTCHFAGGWASQDFDNDSNPASCSQAYENVAQHYCSCWNINLGSDADEPHADGGWGPHASTPAVMTPLGLGDDGTAYTRLSRFSRWARW